MSNKPGQQSRETSAKVADLRWAVTGSGSCFMVAPASGHWPELRSWEFGAWHHRNTRPV